MKHIFLAVILTLTVVFSTVAQAPNAKEDGARLLTLVKEVQGQQGQIIANQKAMEAKLAEVVETVRVARIFSSRGR